MQKVILTRRTNNQTFPVRSHFVFSEHSGNCRFLVSSRSVSYCDILISNNFYWRIRYQIYNSVIFMLSSISFSRKKTDELKVRQGCCISTLEYDYFDLPLISHWKYVCSNGDTPFPELYKEHWRVMKRPISTLINSSFQITNPVSWTIWSPLTNVFVLGDSLL